MLTCAVLTYFLSCLSGSEQFAEFIWEPISFLSCLSGSERTQSWQRLAIVFLSCLSGSELTKICLALD